MEPQIFFAVLAGAACHAGWNTVVKLRLDPLAAVSLLAITAGGLSVPMIAVFGLPAAESWPYLAASVTLHVAYNVALSEAYRAGDLGQVYPIARGSAPLMTALVSSFWLGENLGAYGWTGILVVSLGVLLLSLRGSIKGAGGKLAVPFALLTAGTITLYSLADGLGARHSGSAHAYTALLFLLDGLAMAAYMLLRSGARHFVGVLPNLPLLTLGGALSIASYWIAIWAMTVAPIGLVAALRETSVLFATLFAVVLLREPLLPARITAACLVVAGVVLIRMH